MYFQSGERVYINVLGNAGELYGLHIAVGEENFFNLAVFLHAPDLGYERREAQKYLDMLSVEWDDKRFLTKDQVHAMKKLKRIS